MRDGDGVASLGKALSQRLEGRYGVAAAAIHTHLIPALGPERPVQSGEELMLDGSAVNHCIVVAEGSVAQYKLLPSGRRQITGICIAGDIANLTSLFLHRADHGLVTVGPAVIRTIAHEQLRQLVDTVPDIRRAVSLHLSEDLLLHRERMLSMGRRSTMQHFAIFVCELYRRLAAVDQVEPDGFRLPLTQTDIADIMGLSTVHVNRVMKQLREAGLLRMSAQRIIVDDWTRLREIAGFRNHALSTLFPEKG